MVCFHPLVEIQIPVPVQEAKGADPPFHWMPAVRTIEASIIRASSGSRLLRGTNVRVLLGLERTRVRDHIAILLGGAAPSC
jgi:hypothetical protein